MGYQPDSRRRCEDCGHLIKKRRLFSKTIYRCQYYGKVDTWLGYDLIIENPEEKNKNGDCNNYIRGE